MKRNPVRPLALLLALSVLPVSASAYELNFEPIPGSVWTLTIPDDFFSQGAATAAPTTPADTSACPCATPTPTASPSGTPTPTCQPSATPAPTCQPTTAPTATPAPTTTPLPTDTPSQSAQMNAYEQKMLSLVNAERAKAGKSALSFDAQLTYWARAKSQDMIDKSYFAHQSPTYGNAADMLRSAGIAFTACGENIARYGTLEKAHEGLMSSPGHRANILNGAMTRVGIGVARDSAGNFYVTQIFVR